MKNNLLSEILSLEKDLARDDRAGISGPASTANDHIESSFDSLKKLLELLKALRNAAPGDVTFYLGYYLNIVCMIEQLKPLKEYFSGSELIQARPQYLDQALCVGSARKTHR